MTSWFFPIFLMQGVGMAEFYIHSNFTWNHCLVIMEYLSKRKRLEPLKFKIAFFAVLNSPKSIWHKIWITEEFFNLLTVTNVLPILQLNHFGNVLQHFHPKWKKKLYLSVSDKKSNVNGCGTQKVHFEPTKVYPYFVFGNWWKIICKESTSYDSI